MTSRLIPPSERDWFYVQEVALANGCNEKTVRQWIKQRKLQATKSTQSWVITAAGLRAAGKAIPDIGVVCAKEFWRAEIESEVSSAVQSKYAHQLDDLLLASFALNDSIEELHDTVRKSGLKEGEYPALAFAVTILSVRLFHAGRAIACLAANSHGSEARPVSRQASEIVAVLIDLDRDKSGQRARAWLKGQKHYNGRSVMATSFGASGAGIYSFHSDDAHGRPSHLGLEMVRRLNNRDHVWIPLADAEEDVRLLKKTSAELRVAAETANLLSLDIRAGRFGSLADMNELVKIWTKQQDDDDES